MQIYPYRLVCRSIFVNSQIKFRGKSLYWYCLFFSILFILVSKYCEICYRCFLMGSTGKRIVRPPDRLLDALFQSQKLKLARKIPLNKEKSELTHSDLVNILKRNAKEARTDHQVLILRFDQLKEKLAASDGHVSNVETSIDTVHCNEMDQQVVTSKAKEQPKSVYSEADLLKETVKRLLLNAVTPHVKVPLNQSSFLFLINSTSVTRNDF